MGRDPRQQILLRRRRFLGAALAAAGLGSAVEACRPNVCLSVEPEPCLSVEPEPCLSPPYDPDAGGGEPVDGGVTVVEPEGDFATPPDPEPGD